MRILVAAFAALVFLFVLWGPAFAVALRSWRRGNPYAFRQLRFLCPAQLVAAVSLAFAADLLGLRNPAALAAASTVCASLIGAGALAIILIEGKMKRPFFAGMLVLLVAVLITAGMWIKREVSIDRCLDRGGRWNDEVAACEFVLDGDRSK